MMAPEPRTCRRCDELVRDSLARLDAEQAEMAVRLAQAIEERDALRQEVERLTGELREKEGNQ